jgi:5'/3'-nucleotidase SurE
MKLHRYLVAVTVLLMLAPNASALDILVCNDDGFTSANTRALYEQLLQAGHRVIIAAPVDNQSGRGGFVSFLAPIPRIPASYIYPYTGRSVVPRAVRATYPSLIGTPGIGVDPIDPNISYVNGSPVMACLYGIDVKAPKTFAKLPDLVISGPNEGNNIGHINVSSGTVNAVYYAINRGLPAIAVSDAATASVEFTALTPASRANEVAAIVVQLVDALDQARQHAKGRLMPRAVGLNVNVPNFAAGDGDTLSFALTHMGVATSFAPAFYEDLGLNPLAASAGIPAGAGLAGIGLATGGAQLPTGVTLPTDNSPDSEGNVIAAGAAVSVSVIAGVPEAERFGGLKEVLKDLSRCDTDSHPGRHGRSHGCAW